MKITFTTGNNLYAYFVRLVTLGKWSHCGIVIDNIEYQSRPFKGVYKHEYNATEWKDSIDIEVTEEEKLKCIEFLESELNCGYDYAGVIRFIIPFVGESKTKWFCSELVVDALQKINIITKTIPAYKWSPKKLYNNLFLKK